MPLLGVVSIIDREWGESDRVQYYMPRHSNSDTNLLNDSFTSTVSPSHHLPNLTIASSHIYAFNIRALSYPALVRPISSRHLLPSHRFQARTFAQARPNFKMAAVIDTNASAGSVVVMEKVSLKTYIALPVEPS